MPENPVNIAIGDYGGRRSGILAALVRGYLENKHGEDYHKVVNVHGTGHKKFKKSGKLNTKHIDAVKKAVAEVGHTHLMKHLEDLASRDRLYMPGDALKGLKELYAVDTFIGDRYKESGVRKVKTVLEAANMNHGKWGIDLDDTEHSQHYTMEVTVPELQKQKPKEGAPKSPEDADWHSLRGGKYKAGSVKALYEEGRDLVQLAGALAEEISNKYYSNRK